MMKNYKWQDEAQKLFLNNKKLVVEVVTGAGKTYFSIQVIKNILEKNPNKNIIICSPKIIILKNWQKELLRNGFSVLDIGLFYGACKDYGQILLTTNASIKNINLDLFDILIIDEVHNSFTPQFKKIYNSNWDYLLGLTATLNNLDSVKHYQYLKYFDYNQYKYSMGNALQDKIINNFDFNSVSIKLKDKNKIKKYKEIQKKINQLIVIHGSIDRINIEQKKKFYKLINDRNKIIYLAKERFDELLKILIENRNKKIIIFNEYNSASTQIYLRCLDNNLSSRIINSNYNSKKINKNLKDFERNKYNILITTKMFDEGYNLPELDVAIIFSGNSTKRQIIQRMGRVLRKKKENSKIYQIFVENSFEEKYAENREKIIENQRCLIC